MYTGGVSLLAEQIANQLQPQEDCWSHLDKRELVRFLGVVLMSYSTCECTWLRKIGIVIDFVL